jgi:hypothetical protein
VRERLRDKVEEDPRLFNGLVMLAIDVTDKNYHKACWVLELVLESRIEWLTPYLDVFCDTLPLHKHEGAMRSTSKICLFTTRYNLKSRELFLEDKHIEKITTACFDWLIGNNKVATKAYAMRALYVLGKDQDWIYPELQQLLLQGFPEHSAGYKAAAKDILRKISQ